MKTKILILFYILSSAFSVCAEDFVAVTKNAKVYDEPSGKYVTLNQNNEDVSPVPGMVFKSFEHTPGWYKIEYSPGLHGFIPEQVVSLISSTPQPGTYKVANNAGETVTVSKDGTSWSIMTGDKKYPGTENNNVIVFTNAKGDPAYSLVDLGNGGIVINYDNSVTKFF